MGRDGKQKLSLVSYHPQKLLTHTYIHTLVFIKNVFDIKNKLAFLKTKQKHFTSMLPKWIFCGVKAIKFLVTLKKKKCYRNE